jgi:hypothetical protein
MAKGEFRRECALHYAEVNGIEIDDEMKDVAIERVISKYVGKQKYVCYDCRVPVKDDDLYCWRCGSDTTEDDTGGFDKLHGKKPPAKKKEEEPKEKPKEKPKKAEPAKPKKAGPSLKKRVEYIRNLDKSTGASAWHIGKTLFEITESGQYKEAHDTFEEFCRAEIGYTADAAHKFIRIAKSFNENEAGKLGMFKLAMLTSAPEAARTKLLKAAVENNLDRDGLKVAIREAWEAEGGRGKKSPGRPKKSVFRKYIGTKAKGDAVKDGTFLLVLDDFVGIEVKVSKKSARAEFVELVEE